MCWLPRLANVQEKMRKRSTSTGQTCRPVVSRRKLARDLMPGASVNLLARVGTAWHGMIPSANAGQ